MSTDTVPPFSWRLHGDGSATFTYVVDRGDGSVQEHERHVADLSGLPPAVLQVIQEDGRTDGEHPRKDKVETT